MGITGCLSFLFLALFFMPVMGLIIVCRRDSRDNVLGWALLLLGCIFWIIFAAILN